MAVKLVEVPEIGRIALYKRKGVRGVRLSIAHDGTVRVTLPNWAPYRLGIEFVQNKADWILDKQKPALQINTGDKIGKAHHLTFEIKPNMTKPTSRINGTNINISVPNIVPITDKSVQVVAEKAAIRALKKEAEQLLPQRLASLALKHGFTYRSVSIKRLRSRWGSCNEHKDIVLNCFLMQLPWHLIDYVLLHELTHTRVFRHGEPFWSELGKYVRDLKALRKEMKSHQPTLSTQPGPIFDDDGTRTLRVAIESM